MLRRGPRQSQPQGRAEIDWSNPFTNGVLLAFNGATPTYSPIAGPQYTLETGVTLKTGRTGMAPRSANGGNFTPYGVAVANGPTIPASGIASGPLLSHLFVLDKWVSSAGNTVGSALFLSSGSAYIPITSTGFVVIGYSSTALLTSSNSIASGQPAVILAEISPDGYRIVLNGVETTGARTNYNFGGLITRLCNGQSGQGNLIAEFNLIAIAAGQSLGPLLANPWQLFRLVSRSLLIGTVAAGGGATGTLAATESGTDTGAFSGSLLAQGAIAATEAASDTAAFAGTALAQGTLASTETGSDTAAFTGSAIETGTGTLAATESGTDAAAFTGTLLSQGSIAATESAVDTAAFSASAQVQGALAAVETGSDTAAFFSAEQISTRFGISYEGYTAKRPGHRTRSVIKKKVIQAAAKVAALAETVENYEQHKTRYRGLMLEELSQPVWNAEFERIIQIQLELQEEEDLIALLL